MKQSQRLKELETILVLLLALCILCWHYKNFNFLLAAIVIGVTGLFIPSAGRAINFTWTKLSEGLGFIMSNVILTVIFIIVVVPFGLISVKLGKSSVKLKRSNKSYFVERNHDYAKEDILNPW